jgi:hypothetical protein
LNKPKDALGTSVAHKGKQEDVDPEFEGLMSEIEGDLRADEFKKIWASYGNLIIAFAVTVVVGVGGFQFYRHQQAETQAAVGRQFEVAIQAEETGKTDEAIKQLSSIPGAPGTAYGPLARLSQAALLINKKDIPGALAIYKALAADTTADPMFREFATLLHVMHSLDTADAKALEAEIAPLAAGGGTFAHSALELQALLAAKQGDTARAVKTLAQISADPATPAAMRDRVTDLTKLYEAGVVPKPPAIPPAPAAPAASATPPAAQPAAKP